MKFLLLSFALILPLSAAPTWINWANIPPKSPSPQNLIHQALLNHVLERKTQVHQFLDLR